MHEELENF
jgi:hypothetical protein